MNRYLIISLSFLFIPITMFGSWFRAFIPGKDTSQQKADALKQVSKKVSSNDDDNHLASHRTQLLTQRSSQTGQYFHPDDDDNDYDSIGYPPVSIHETNIPFEKQHSKSMGTTSADYLSTLFYIGALDDACSRDEKQLTKDPNILAHFPRALEEDGNHLVRTVQMQAETYSLQATDDRTSLSSIIKRMEAILVATTQLPNARGAISAAEVSPIDQLLQTANTTLDNSIRTAMQEYKSKKTALLRLRSLLRTADLTNELTPLQSERTYELLTEEDKKILNEVWKEFDRLEQEKKDDTAATISDESKK
jgi:hypothetical protein